MSFFDANLFLAFMCFASVVCWTEICLVILTPLKEWKPGMSITSSSATTMTLGSILVICIEGFLLSDPTIQSLNARITQLGFAPIAILSMSVCAAYVIRSIGKIRQESSLA